MRARSSRTVACALALGTLSSETGCASASSTTPGPSLEDGSKAGVGKDGSVDGAPFDSAESGPQNTGASEAGEDAGCDSDAESPGDLCCTGLYSDCATKTIAPDVTAYAPAYTLWSDGAQKSRWIYLPPGSQIDTSDMDDWSFPVGTKVWKEFRWPSTDAGAAYEGAPAGQRVETRLLWKRDFGWDVLDYRWSADQSSATLLLGGATGVDGTTYEIPPVSECYECHEGRNDMVLGFDLIGTGAPGAQGMTLAELATAGRLTRPPPSTSIVIPEDETNLAAPTLGFLHVNCGVTCHNGNEGAEAIATSIRFKLLAAQMYPEGGAGRVSELDTYVTTVNVTASDMPNGMTYRLVVPGHAKQSLVPLMALARDPDAGGFDPMPPIASHVADSVDVAKVQAWIDAL
jgi:hypothetical protein